MMEGQIVAKSKERDKQHERPKVKGAWRLSLSCEPSCTYEYSTNR